MYRPRGAYIQSVHLCLKQNSQLSGKMLLFYPWSLIFVRHPYMLLLPHGRFSNSIICLVWPLMASLEGSKNALALPHYQIRKGFQRHRIGKNTCTTFFQWFKSYNKDHLTTYISWLNIRWRQQKNISPCSQHGLIDSGQIILFHQPRFPLK